MNETGKESAKPPAPAPATPASAAPTSTNNESRNNYRGNRRGNSKRENEGGTRGSEQKNFRGETPELNVFLGIIIESLDQGVTFEKFQDVLKNFHKTENIVEMVTDLNDPLPKFGTKHMPKERTKKEEESKMKMKMWEMRVKKFIDREELLT